MYVHHRFSFFLTISFFSLSHTHEGRLYAHTKAVRGTRSGKTWRPTLLERVISNETNRKRTRGKERKKEAAKRRREERKAKTRPDGNDPKLLGSLLVPFFLPYRSSLPLRLFDTSHPSFFLSSSSSSSSFSGHGLFLFLFHRLLYTDVSFFHSPFSLPIFIAATRILLFFSLPDLRQPRNEYGRSTNGNPNPWDPF